MVWEVTASITIVVDVPSAWTDDTLTAIEGVLVLDAADGRSWRTVTCCVTPTGSMLTELVLMWFELSSEVAATETVDGLEDCTTWFVRRILLVTMVAGCSLMDCWDKTALDRLVRVDITVDSVSADELEL
jgi:hypothetical protein